MKVLVLAGGGGTRLWPLSRKSYPKQFLKLFGKESLFQKTIRRILNFSKSQDVIVLTNQRHLAYVKADLQEMGIKDIHVLLEPHMKNTGPAILLGMRYALDALHCAPDTALMVLPSDHILGPDNKFTEMVQTAERLSKSGYLITFGIKPTRPETGYGYIKLGDPFKNEGNAFWVEAFVEKPDINKAIHYLESGCYLWNSGMFCFTIDTMLSELRTWGKEVTTFCNLNYQELIQQFSEMPNISIDYLVMERSKRILVVVEDIFWSDVGSWDAIYDIKKKDLASNVVDVDSHVLVGSKRNLVMGRDRLIALVGVNDAIVVDSDDALLVAKRGKSQMIKDVVSALEAQGRREADSHREEIRPWGSFRELFVGQNFKVKHIVVNPSCKLSLQRHNHRSEHWVIVKGKARVTVGERLLELKEDQYVYIPKGVLHRVESFSNEALEIIEVQYGDYLAEDDIERLEDDYGRA